MRRKLKDMDPQERLAKRITGEVRNYLHVLKLPVPSKVLLEKKVWGCIVRNTAVIQQKLITGGGLDGSELLRVRD